MKEKVQTQKDLKLKPKEKEFVKVFVRKHNENGTQSVREVFGTKSIEYARLKAHRLIMKDNVRQAIEMEKETLKSALEKQGITPEKIALKVDELLENEDPNAIDKGLKHATAIYGVEEEKPRQNNNTYNFLFSTETQAEIKAIEDKIKAKLLEKRDA